MKQMKYKISDLKNHIVRINSNFFDLREKLKIISNKNEKLQKENKTLAYKLNASGREKIIFVIKNRGIVASYRQITRGIKTKL